LKFTVGLVIIFLTVLGSCSQPLTHLEHIKQRGELIVLSRYSPTTYHKKGDHLVGLEYELAQQFAQRLGVKLKVVIPDNLSDMIHLLELNKADIAAAGLTVTPKREKNIHFGPVYQEVTQQLVYRQGNKRPKSLTAINGGLLEVVADSSHVEQLQQHHNDIPKLKWTTNKLLDSSRLLELVQLEMIDYTIADSNEITAHRNLLPELRVAFDVSEPQPLAWAMSLSEDKSLSDEVTLFFEDITATEKLDRLIEKYYGHVRRFDYVDTRAIYRKILTELPKYQALFEQAGEKFDIDWRLIAAISYQESHWNPKAVSNTGVKGLMMVTNATAKQMKIKNREDPKQSVDAGTGYLDLLRNRLPERILEPDKTWLALAAYNVGFGHLEDARILTQNSGKNPDVWPDVKKHLPLLSKKKWYSQTRHGYARGREPVRYIENIRRYFDILLYDRQKGHLNQTPKQGKLTNTHPSLSPLAL
jgi:membrane-bound lytic murein transglycosylase F